MEEDIRWKQRLVNFNKAFILLKEAVELYPNLSTIEKEGLVQRFEYTFELAWKTIKDYLQYQEIDCQFPREVVKKAFENDIIKNGEIWIEMLESRNELAHTYNENNFNKALNNITNRYYFEIKNIENWLQKQL
jgi:nucleotidyltransferase substrate binding protein (TIGR01987 family)